MKKKTSIRERREQVANAKKNDYRNIEEKRKAIDKAKREAEAAAAEAARLKELEEQMLLNPVRERKLKEENKSTAKAAGLKSTFILSSEKNELLMTSFGRGNNAIIEKRIINNSVKSIAEPSALSVTPIEEKQFRIDGRVPNAQTDNPLYTAPKENFVSHPREDLIHAKAKLEKLYFGQEFEDNIHIQAIYNILDIEKILTIHVNNIIYTINNFLREDGNDLTDIVGYITDYSSLDKLEAKAQEIDNIKVLNAEDAEKVKKAKMFYDLFLRLCNAKQLGYLNLEVGTERKRDNSTVRLTKAEFFSMLFALGKMRQMLAHENPKQNIYHFDVKKYRDIHGLLDRLYRDRVNELNDGFLEKADKNLVLLFEAYAVQSVPEKKNYVREYYDFTVRKQYKNQGFSVKLLREHMTADIEEAFVLRDIQYDSVRAKLYAFVDFAIFHYYQARKKEAEDLVSNLRASFNEVEKDQVYRDEAKRIWPELQNVIMKHILPQMKGSVIRGITPDKDVTSDMLSGIRISSTATAFSEYIYMLTLFINGKEINDLLTTLLSKFENIDSFLFVMKEGGLHSRFEEKFEIFTESGKVAEELRVINSFARMVKPSASAKKIMYIEALQVLGIKSADPEREAEEILDPETKHIDPQKRGLRNFIANNVIESERFKYLVRYGNVRKLKGIAANRKVIEFVLKEIPDAQITRYHNSITGCNDNFHPEMRTRLTDALTGFSFEDISDVVQNDRESSGLQQEDKRRKQALVRLYLTSLYLALKNLVYINSRYFLAFHCVERDRYVLFPDIPKKSWKNEYGKFAKIFLENYPQKKRVQNYLSQNFDNSDEYAIRVFRNKVEHLDAVRNADLYLKDIRTIDSWFDLYHYVMQRRIKDQYDFDCRMESRENPGTMVISEEQLNPKTLIYFDQIMRFKTYCKDMLKSLCVPFAYNLPRYKNLSIEGLFDMNRPGKREDTNNKAMGAEL